MKCLKIAIMSRRCFKFSLIPVAKNSQNERDDCWRRGAKLACSYTRRKARWNDYTSLTPKPFKVLYEGVKSSYAATLFFWDK